MLHDGSIVNIAGFQGNLGLFQELLSLLSVRNELLLCTIHFCFQVAEPSMQIMLPERMSDRFIIF